MPAKKVPSTSHTKVEPQNSTGRLSGKVAVITGGSSGIGFAIAQALAAEDCNIVITGRDQKRLSAALSKLSAIRHGAEARGQTGDVRDPASVSALFAMVEERFGRLDILVNNAGISQPPTPLEQTSLELWRDQIESNLTSLFLCTRAALPLMKAGATIINNLSLAAKQIFPNFHGYTAAKTGALGFTLSLRAEVMERGIRVTALIPGATATDLWQQIIPDAPLERMVKPESIAQAVLYAVLLPPEANLSEIIVTPILGAV